MRTHALLVASAATAVMCHPGMQAKIDEIASRATTESGDSFELLGDLLTLKDNQLTRVGKDVKKILQGGDAESDERYAGRVPPLQSPACRKDTCCVWKYIADEMNQHFVGNSGRCNKFARGAVRLGFHDAGAWSKTSGRGGADGSILLTNEINRVENRGLEAIAAYTNSLYKKYTVTYKYTDLSMADFIQMGATVAAVACPLGPRIKSYVGRRDDPREDPENLLPSVRASADSLIQLFREKTIEPNGLVALLGAHTTSQQHFVNVSRAGDPQDSTPGVWDVLYYGQTQGTVPAPPRVFKFPSDVKISQHPATRGEWREFAGQGGQREWNEYYAREYVRLSLLGVNNINKLTECTKVLPAARRSFSNPDQSQLTTYLGSSSRNTQSNQAAGALEQGQSIQSVYAQKQKTKGTY